MSQVQSITLNHLSLPTHSFVPPKFIIPLNRRNFSFTLPSLSVKCYRPNLIQPKPFPPPPQPQRPPVRELPQKVYVDYSVYTRKGVLTVAPRPPEFETTSSGAFKVSREGYVTCSSSIKSILSVLVSLKYEKFTCVLKYVWMELEGMMEWKENGDKDAFSFVLVFALSVSEMGTLISLGATGSWEFFHETMKPKSDDDIEVKKVLKVEPLVDATGHLFSLSVQKKPQNMEEIQDSIFIPVSRAELTVLRSIFNYIMPYLLGWNAFANSIKPEVYSRVNSTNPRYGTDNEWNR
ncbi:Single-stranded DNA-binding protein WHY1, chloroplastic, partial [Mucuna pruriens]